MRVLLPALVVAAMTLSGCAGYELEGLVPPPGEDGGNWTMEPLPVPVEPEPAPPAGAVVPSHPVVTSVAVADFTAPVALELDRVVGEAATLSLVADAQGLRCVSEPSGDPLASPAGYKAVASWARCSLSVDDQAFTSGSADSLAADIPLMQGIPVEAFTWNMTVGRVLVNNTGEHDEVLEEVVRDQSAAPSMRLDHAFEQVGVISASSWSYDVCDTLLTWGEATITLVARAHNGRAALAVDTAGFNVQWVEPIGTQVNATEAQNASRDPLEPIWWMDGDVLHALGPWQHASEARLQFMIIFEGQDGYAALIPPLECPDALFVDDQYLPIDASAIGIAAGWVDSHVSPLSVQVWHTP